MVHECLNHYFCCMKSMKYSIDTVGTTASKTSAHFIKDIGVT